MSKPTDEWYPRTENQRPAARKITPTFLSCTKVICPEPAAMSLRPLHVDPSVNNLIAVLTSEFPSLTNAPPLLHSMNAQSSFKEGKPSKQVVTLLERVQFADPCSPDIDEDNTCQSWGHYQFTVGGISPASSLTNWQEVGNVTTAFKLVAAAIKTDIYLEKILKCLENCWFAAGGVLTSQKHLPPIPTTPSYRNVAMSPPRVPIIRIKRPAPSVDVASKISEACFGDNKITPSVNAIMLRIPTADATDRKPEEPPSWAETPGGLDAASGTLRSAREIFRHGLGL
ncbi:hypothetical protein EDB89DRAFT_2083115 [Lactarius sanguifluus]|nr:hypothetical protein EDB89DRAFT_2083115 [Lactarius sanguifluus]